MLIVHEMDIIQFCPKQQQICIISVKRIWCNIFVVFDKIGNHKQSKYIGNNSRRQTNRQTFLKWIIRKTGQSKLCKTETTRKFVCMDLLQHRVTLPIPVQCTWTLSLSLSSSLCVFVNMCQGPVNIINVPKYFIGEVSDVRWRFYGDRINGDADDNQRQPATAGWI